MTMVDEKSVIDDKLSHLVGALLQKTREGKVSWKPTVNDGEFLAGFKRYVVSIRQDSLRFEGDPSQEHLIELSLLNQDGKVMETKASSSGQGSIWGSSLSDDYENLHGLFVLARRSAHNVEEGLDSLLKELESR